VKPRLGRWLIPLLLAGWMPLSAEALTPPSQDVMDLGGFTYQPEAPSLDLPVEGAHVGWRVHVEPGHGVTFVDILRGGKSHFRHKTQSLNLPSGLVERILVANHVDGVVRIAVRGRRPIRLVPQLVRNGEGWTLKVRIEELNPSRSAERRPEPPRRPRPPRPTPSPSLRPVPTTVPTAPPSPPPSPFPSPRPTPVPSLHPTPVRPPAPVGPTWPDWSRGADRFSTFTLLYRVLGLYEDFASGGSNRVSVGDIGTLDALWSQRWKADWSTRADLSILSPYSIQDADLRSSTHSHQEVAGSVGAEWHPVDRPFALGAGYWVRDVNNQNTVNPIAPLYLYSRLQLFHGPQLEASGRLPLWGTLRLVASTRLHPAVFAVFDSDVPDPGLLYSAEADAGLEFTYRSIAFRALYSLATVHSYDAGSFERDLSGWGLQATYQY